ncbi:MAG: zinc ABC transporter substrate-binding protein [Nocardioides sp.]|nr:zinc ABC transporter substrate-binding protein [Nocardioides sp.]
MKLWVLAATAAVALTLSGCAAFTQEAPAADGQLKVVAGLYPLQWIAQQVAGRTTTVTNLTNPGQEPHDLELTPAETADVAQADVVVYLKGLQAAVDAAANQVAGGTALDVSHAARLVPLSHGGHDDISHHGAGETADDEAQESKEALDGLDPHFWQDPTRLADVADTIARTLAKADPQHAATFRANAETVRSKLTSLDHAYAAGLAHCTRNTIVVSHNAFGYLDRYGIRVEPIAGLSPDAEPTAADLARLHDLIAKEGITTVFGERLAPPQLTESLARDAGVRTAVLDPVEGLDSATAHDDYLSLMRANLAALRKANACQ